MNGIHADAGRVTGSATVHMIKLTQLNGRAIVVNADLIEFVETAPDTIISLTTGKKILVQESDEEVIRLTAKFRRLCRTTSLSAEPRAAE